MKEGDACSNLKDGLLIRTQDWARTHVYYPFEPRLILGLGFYLRVDRRYQIDGIWKSIPPMIFVSLYELVAIINSRFCNDISCLNR